MAVSFDDAWNTQIIEEKKPTHLPEISSKFVRVTEEEAEISNEMHTKPKRYRPEEHSTIRKRRRRYVDPDSDSESSDIQSSESESEPESEPESVMDKHELISEIRDLRERYEHNVHMNNILLYTAVTMVIILLVTVFHTQNRLHYTTECLLWYLKSSRIS